MAVRFFLAQFLFVLVVVLVGCERPPEELEEVDATTRRARRLLLDQRQNDARIWYPEVEARDYERSLSGLVDRLRYAADRLAVLQELEVGEFRFRRPGPTEPVGWGVDETQLDGPPPLVQWDSVEWRAWFEVLVTAQTTIDYFQLRLTKFVPGNKATNGLASAVVALDCHAKQRSLQDPSRLIYHSLKGELTITWDRPLPGGDHVGPIARVGVDQLRWLRSAEERAFVEKRRYAVGDPDKRQGVRITPIMVKDLDGDQRAEIVLGGVNLLLRNQGGFEFQDEPFLNEDINLRSVAALADFTGEGYLDVLGFLADGSPILVEGGANGGFTETSSQPWPERVLYPSSLAVADVDGDGDLDVWLAQHRPTYHGGVLPQSIADASDGFPSRLFRNEGGGSFVEVTEQANLGSHRSRRTQNAAFIDFDRDGDADLLVASDYAGIKLHRNDGKGVFTDTTDSTFGHWRMFGLCAAVGRFDEDEHIDVFAGGRWSVAMHRIDGLQLERADFPDLRTTAINMASGNQLFLSQRNYETGPFNADAKKTGWTNSATAADFDNDDDDDLYLATGHLTGRSVDDFDSQFWRNDVFLSKGVSPEVLQRYFQTEDLIPRLSSLRRGEISWYGYDANRLEMNGEDGFIDLGYLHGVALSHDSPAALAADLDNDGRMDLLTIAQRSFPSEGRLVVEQSLIIYENALPSDGHWIGVHLVPNAPGFTDMGVTVRLSGEFGERERFLATDLTSVMQGPATAHFGLGKHEKVDHLHVRWSNGHEQIILAPELDRYHTVSPRLDFTPVPDPPEEPEEVVDVTAGENVETVE